MKKHFDEDISPNDLTIGLDKMVSFGAAPKRSLHKSASLNSSKERR